MHLFSNNGRATLAAPLGPYYEDSQILLTSEEDVFSFANFGSYTTDIDKIDWDNGEFQMATLFDPADPSVVEIVKIGAIVGKDSMDPPLSHDAFLVLRGQENTDLRDWPAGTVIEARVTAGMLKSFVQDLGQLAMLGRLTAYGQSQLKGWPVSLAARANMDEPPAYSHDDFAREAVGSTLILSLGVTPVWQSGEIYRAGSVVKAAENPGYQHVFEAYSNDATTSSVTLPAFDATGWRLAKVYAPGESEANGDKPLGFWTPTPDPIDMSVTFDYPVMLTEVGFVCDEYTTTTVPTISVGTDTQPGKYVSAQPLSQIAGGAHCHRFVITEGGPLLSSLRIKLDVPADGLFTGRFYWRGVPFELLSSQPLE